MAEKPWIKRLKLALCALVGVAIVSVPVTVAAGFAAAGEDDAPLIISTDLTPGKSDENPSKVVARAMGCDATEGYYALTFDDGPYPETTARLVRTLDQADAVATFFDVGERVTAHPELVRLQRTVGQVANHSYTHPHLPQLTSERRLEELTVTARALSYPNAWVRPPFGETDPGTDADMAETGLTPVYWTTDTYDWQQ